MITSVGPRAAELGVSAAPLSWVVVGGVGWLNGSLFLVFDCFARCRSLSADRALESAYFVVARGRKACPRPPPQRGAWRDPVFTGCRTGLPDPSEHSGKAG